MKKDILTVHDAVEDFAGKLSAKDTQQLIALDSVFVCLMSYLLTFDPCSGGVFEPEDRPKIADWARIGCRALPRKYQKTVRQEMLRLKDQIDEGNHQAAREAIESVMSGIEKQMRAPDRQPPPGYRPPDEELR